MDHKGPLLKRIEDRKNAVRAKTASRNEHLRLAELLEREIGFEQIKLTELNELAEDYDREAQADAATFGPGRQVSTGSFFVELSRNISVPLNHSEEFRRGKRNTKAKIMDYVRSLNGAEFGIGDALKALRVADPEIPDGTVGNTLGTLVNDGKLERPSYGRYQESVSSRNSAPGFDTDQAEDEDDEGSSEDAGNGGGSDA